MLDVYHSISEIPFAKYFTINNSGFGLPDATKEVNLTHKMFFDLGMKQFKLIFDHITNPKFKSVSINNSLQTLKERDNITNWLYAIGEGIKLAMDRQDEARKLVDNLEANKHKMDANEDYKIQVPITKIVKEPTKNYTTYCQNCTNTCHPNCGIPDDADKRGCSAMSWETGLCTVCKDKCSWHAHKNMPYIIKRVKDYEWKTKQEMFEQYNLAQDKAANCEKLCNKMLEEIQETEDRIRQTIVLMRESVDRLREIALNKKVLTDKQYFDKLIMQEEEERKGKWKQRVEQLKRMRDHNELLNEVVQGDEDHFIAKKVGTGVDDIKKRKAIASPTNKARKSSKDLDDAKEDDNDDKKKKGGRFKLDMFGVNVIDVKWGNKK